jgi:hypothetical protein
MMAIDRSSHYYITTRAHKKQVNREMDRCLNICQVKVTSYSPFIRLFVPDSRTGRYVGEVAGQVVDVLNEEYLETELYNDIYCGGGTHDQDAGLVASVYTGDRHSGAGRSTSTVHYVDLGTANVELGTTIGARGWKPKLVCDMGELESRS